MTRKRAPGTFGTVETLPSGRHRARYRGPDGRRYTAPTLFLTKKDARGWLSLRQSEIIKREWLPPGATDRPHANLQFQSYAETWLQYRDLKSRTRDHYSKLLNDHLLPTFGTIPIASITPDDVRAWHSAMGTNTPTLRAHAYGLLRTIMNTAANDGKIVANPCVIRGAGSAKRKIKIRPASTEEVTAIAEAMPDHLRMMVLLAAWCALRFGELTELRRGDITIVDADSPDDSYGIAHIDRGVVRTGKGFEVTTPKSDAGRRDVEIPPHLLSALKRHLATHVAAGQDSLLFPALNGGHLAPASLYRHYYRAREAAGRRDLRWHDLRHSGAVFAAATGATLAELMGRLGHSTPAASLRYQHAAQGRDRQIAKLLSKIAIDGASRHADDTP
ncbi:tyrosine-type recombinase/integrase [Mycolicibacterium sp. jd]|uniref:tyrosine-type recombinase/integrase n=1 Tax=unclassified Mycolicibacterium TaxID=2636767 RepID=UPI00351BA400